MDLGIITLRKNARSLFDVAIDLLKKSPSCELDLSEAV
jgi:hypothetical protein